MRLIGIDYSMSSPAMTVCEGPVTWESCSVYYLTSSKKCVGTFANCEGVLMPEWTTQEQRFDSIADFFVSKLRPTDKVLIEGYAMGGKGRVFHIGENTGVLKHKLWRLGVDFVVAPPTVIKKFATGKGNSNKEAMNDAFVTQTGFDVKAAMGLTADQWNPSSDVIDSFFACALLERDGENLSRG